LNLLDRFFKKPTNIKCHENPSTGSQAVPCGWVDRQADMMKLIVAFCNFANTCLKIRVLNNASMTSSKLTHFAQTKFCRAIGQRSCKISFTFESTDIFKPTEQRMFKRTTLPPS